jgi:hypothetical protein
MTFSSLHPLCKLGSWVLLLTVASTAIHGAAWLVGLDFNILSNDNGGRGVMLAVAMAALLFVVAADRRPIADFGLFIGPRWKHRLFGGMAIGVFSYVAYLIPALLVGVYSIQTDGVTLSRCLTGSLSSLTSFPLALTQQIVFSGYLLSMLRDRYHRTVAVAVSAAVFAVLNQLQEPESLLRAETQPLLLGLFLAATLLGVMRLQTGNILFPAGMLAGWLFVRRLSAKTGLLATQWDSPLLNWFAPAGDARRAPAMIAVLSVAIIVSWLLLRRRGEGKAPLSSNGIDADFKRVFPFSHTSGLAPIDLWISLLVSVRFRIGLKYLPRLAAILVVSTFNTVLTLPERILLPLLLRRRHVPDPVFVVGVHRSGTSHLHNLLSLDPQFCTARQYQTMNPIGFLFSGWLITPLLALFMPWKRPMDSVRMSMFSPQEEEFAIAGSCRMSPYWGMTFPRCWPEFDRYIFPDRLTEREKGTWQRQYLFFLQKLTLWTRRRPLLKSPHNTGRVVSLLEIFPQAKFIHICRHPYTVYRSNAHLAREGHVINQLHDPDECNSYEAHFLNNYRAMEEAFARDSCGLPNQQVIKVRFEDLEHDPIATIRQIYHQLGIEFTAEYRRRLTNHLNSLKGYEKNRYHTLPDQQRQLIDTAMGAFMAEWGYQGEQVLPRSEPRKAA